MSTRTKPIDVKPAETAAERVVRLRAELEDVQGRITAMRQARGRGEAVDPLDITAARLEAETLADQLEAAQEARARGDAAEVARQEAEAARTRLRSVDHMLAATEARTREVHDAAERLGAALDALHQHARDASAVEPALGARWINGVVERSKEQIASAWPARLSLELSRPIPFRDAAKRAAWPQEERDVLRLLLGPLPADPDAAAAPDAAA